MKSERKNKTFYKPLLYQCINTLIQLITVVSFIFILGFFTFSKNCLAAIVFEISNPIINENDEIEVDASISGLISSSCSAEGCYLQAQMRASDESKGFFGYTYNNSGEFVDYFSSTTSTDEIKTKLFNFIPVSGSWIGKLKAKNNFTDPNYIGPGQYNLKFRRFSGNSTSATSSDSKQLTLTLSLGTPIPSPTPTEKPVLTPTVTVIPSPTVTPTLLSIPTKKPTSKPTHTPTPDSLETESPSLGLEFIDDENAIETPTGIVAGATTTKKKPPYLALFFIVSGLGFLGYVGYTFYIGKIKKNENI